MKKPNLSDATLGLISVVFTVGGFIVEAVAQGRADAKQEEIYDAIVGKKEEE